MATEQQAAGGVCERRGGSVQGLHLGVVYPAPAFVKLIRLLPENQCTLLLYVLLHIGTHFLEKKKS